MLGILGEIVAVRSDVVIDNIQDDAETVLVSGVDHLAEVVGGAIAVKGREKVDAVVAPADIPGELGQRHAFENSDSQLTQARKLADRRTKVTFRGEGANVQFIENLPLDEILRASSLRIRSSVGGRVDDFR